MGNSLGILDVVRSKGGYITAKELNSRSEYNHLLKKVREGEIVRVSPGVYALSESLANTMIDLQKVIPRGILCSYSVWAYYGLTTQVPKSICVAIERDRKVVPPKYPPVTIHSVKSSVFHIGETTAQVGGYTVPIYDIERSVCDAVKARNKIGIDVCSEILKSYLTRTDRNITKLMRYAKRLRVSSTISKYLEIEL